MSARIAPDSIGAVAAVAVDYRPPTPPPAPQIAPAGATTGSSGARSSTTSGPRPETRPASQPSSETGATEKAPPPPLPPETPGADYVRAVISGQLSPRPTSAQELFTRVGTGWTPPESEYRLTEKIA